MHNVLLNVLNHVVVDSPWYVSVMLAWFAVYWGLGMKGLSLAMTLALEDGLKTSQFYLRDDTKRILLACLLLLRIFGSLSYFMIECSLVSILSFLDKGPTCVSLGKMRAFVFSLLEVFFFFNNNIQLLCSLVCVSCFFHEAAAGDGCWGTRNETKNPAQFQISGTLTTFVFFRRVLKFLTWNLAVYSA